MTFYNLARMYTTTTGTGTVTLTTAFPGCNTFANAGIPNGAVLEYTITTYNVLSHIPVDRECGSGTYNSGTLTMTRDTVESSTQGGAKITLTGFSDVLVTILASDANGFGGGGGVASAKYSGSVNTTTLSNNASGAITITDEVWDTASLASVASDTITFGVDGTFHIAVELFWDKPVAGTPNGVLGVHVNTTEGNRQHWEHFETADDMASNNIHMSWTDEYFTNDTIAVTAENYMGMDIRFNVREVTLLKIG